jgi:hypothetical protein
MAMDMAIAEEHEETNLAQTKIQRRLLLFWVGLGCVCPWACCMALWNYIPRLQTAKMAAAMLHADLEADPE